MDRPISTLKLIWLHLFPGILILGLYILLTPTFNAWGFPSLMSLMLSFLFVVVPFEIGYLILKAKKSAVSDSSLRSILVNEAVERKKFVGIVIGGVFLSILVAGLAQTVDLSIKDTFFAWLPDWYFYHLEFSGYSKNILIFTAVIRLLVDGMLIPYAEEIYFRGYLLPRIKAKGVMASILASLLFAVYHFWQPWNYLSLVIISAILVFPAWYFRNYKISLYIHMIINIRIYFVLIDGDEINWHYQ